MSDDLREHIRRLSERAAAMGIGTAFRDAVRRVLEALRQDPRRAGDPLRNLRGLKMTEYRLLREQLVVNYSVHDRIPMVTVWRFQPTSGHPLAPPPHNGD
ncbi:MAG: hypothetical protein J2P46_09395 [Zavarzinella sp.]|nr:hypothetical protein [Zavarzinella sp.]